MPLIKNGRVVEDRYRPHARRCADPRRRSRHRSGGALPRRRRRDAPPRRADRRRVAEQPQGRRARAVSRSPRASSSWRSRTSRTAAATARRGSCGSATDSSASCAPPARCCATSSCSWCAPASTRWRSKKPSDADAFASTLARYTVFYQPAGDDARRSAAAASCADGDAGAARNGALKPAPRPKFGRSARSDHTARPIGRTAQPSRREI